MNPITDTTAQKLGGANFSYAELVKKLNTLKISWKKSEFVNPPPQLIKKDSKNTMETYAAKDTKVLAYNKLVVKYLDPFDTFIMEKSTYLKIVTRPRTSVYALRYEYPIVDSGKYYFTPVLFKIDQATGGVTKFTPNEFAEFQKIVNAVWSCGSRLKAEKSETRQQKIFTDNQALTTLYCNIVNIEPVIPAELTAADLVSVLKEIPETMCFIATEGDSFCNPDLFDIEIATILGKKIDLDLAANKLFLDGFNDDNSTSGDNTDSEATNSALNEANVTVLPGVSTNLLQTVEIFGKEYKYTMSAKKPSPLPNIFLPKTEAEYMVSNHFKDNRMTGLLPKLTFSPTINEDIPPHILTPLPDVPEGKLEVFMELTGSMKGQELLLNLLIEFGIRSIRVKDIVRYEFEVISIMYATLYKASSKIKRKNAYLRITNSMISSLYNIFAELTYGLNGCGIYRHASISEMLSILRFLGPQFFIETQAINPIASETKPVTDRNTTTAILKVLKEKDLEESVSGKIITASSLPAQPGAASTKLTASTKGSKDSGYRSVSSGSKFSQASSYGVNCIKGFNSISYEPVIPERTIVQNIIQAGVALVSTNYEHIYYEEGDIKLSTWLHNPNHVRDAAVHVCKQDVFVRFYPRDINIQMTTVNITSSLQIDVMSDAVIDHLMTGTNIDTRKLASSIMSELRATRRYAEQLAPLALKHTTRYDNSAVYFVGYCIQFAITDMENEDIVPNFGQTPDRAIITFDVSIEGQGVNEEVSRMQNAMAEGRIFLNAKNLTDKDYMIMKLITAGPTSVTTPPNCEVKHIISTISCIGIVKWAVYDDEAINVPLNIQNITSAHVSAFLTKLWVQLGDDDARVTGFIQASAACNGKHFEMERNKVKIHRFVMSTLEIGQINLSRPVGHNFLWKALNIEPARKNADYFKSDHIALSGANCQITNLVSAFVAVFISAGVSCLLDSWNITGADMNACVLAPQNANNLNIIMQQMTVSTNGLGAPLFLVACGFSTQVSSVVINPLVFNGRHWNNQMNGIMDMGYNPEDLWESQKGEWIFYLLNPLAYAFILEAWPTIWHIMAPTVTFEVTKETNMLGPQDMRCWDALAGAVEYTSVGTSVEPYVKVPYGGLVINAFKQHFNDGHAWNITNQVFVQVGDKLQKVGNTERFQPIYDEDFGTIEIGTLITFRWSIQRSIIPSLTPADIGDAMFHVMATSQFNSLNSAGIYLNNTQVGVPLAGGIHGGVAIKGLEIYNVAASTGSTIARSEN